MDFTLNISYKTLYFIYVNEPFSVLHYSSTQQAAIRMLHNDSAKSAEDIQNRMKNQCYRGLQVLLINIYRLKEHERKNSKSDWQ
jgi:hypothetical protein